mgnify:CR=1 FL=1
MASTRPVQDWASDYDIFDPRYVADPFPIWDDLRRTCRVPTDGLGAAATRHEHTPWAPDRPFQRTMRTCQPSRTRSHPGIFGSFLRLRHLHDVT